MSVNIFKTIYKTIKKYDTIVLARHIGADPDALGSTIGLKEIILNNFPNKKVYVIGTPASRHRYIGNLDQYDESISNKALLIVLDTPDKKRIDGANPSNYAFTIKIDHHPFIEKYADIELIDDKASSASQLVMELVINTKLKFNKSGAEKLYIGLIGDTNRFLYHYTTTKTFDLVSKMIKDTKIEFTNLYENMYLKSLKELKLQSYVISNLIVTENGFGYIKIDQNILDEYDTDVATATNVVNSLNYITEVYAWAIFAYDKINDYVRVSIRSRGPIINEVASRFNGGGHIYASGARISNFNIADEFIKELDNVCYLYLKDKNEVKV